MIAELLDLRTKAHYAVYHANRALVAYSWDARPYVEGRAALDAVLLDLSAAKWWLGTFEGTHSAFVARDSNPLIRDRARSRFTRVIECANALTALLKSGKAIPAALSSPPTILNESLCFEDTPLVPTICPIVVLQGSSRDMGRQYAQQIIEIYGRWIFAEVAARKFSDGERRELERWTSELNRYLPDVVEFALGWAEGAAAAGVPMSSDHALAIFTGVRAPATKPRPLAFAFSDEDGESSISAYLGVGRKSGDPVASDLCSGICAWRQATRNGSMVAGASTDHDCTFQATIVAFPEDGHAFIYTPFSVNGNIPILGDMFMAGHPGVNSRGIAYVHHGGANTAEPPEEWGYGLRRGAATLHLLRYAQSAADARDRQLKWPVGDTAVSLGSVGGMFADDRYAFSVEARAGCPDHPNPIIRERTFDALGRPYDFLYANNNAIDPRSSKANAAPPQGYSYSLAGGWYATDPQVIFSEEGGTALRRLITKNSEGRNRYAYSTMMVGYGKIDLDYLMAAYRKSGTLPPGSFEDVCARWHAGETWDCSVAHRNNAFVAFLEPSAPGGSLYRGCIGPLDRAVEVRDPGHGYHYFDETNACWELRLKDSPEAVLDAAAATAAQLTDRARDLLQQLPPSHGGRGALADLLQCAMTELAAVSRHWPAESRQGDRRLAAIARALRAATRAQVRATQVCEAIQPPPKDPAVLLAGS